MFKVVLYTYYIKMSSTNRSNARSLHCADYYTTPQKPIKEFLNKFCQDENIDLSSQKYLILDPCAWWNPERTFLDDKWETVEEKAQDMSYPAVLFEMWADYNKIITNDIREDSPAKYHTNFLESKKKDIYDIVITNPPFNIAQDIIERSLDICKEWGYVIMLLRLNYFGWKIRQEFWKRNMPYRCYVHNRRMGFTPDWKTDSIEYGHFVFKKSYNPKETKLSIIFDF